MKIIVEKDVQAISNLVAQQLAGQVLLKQKSILGLATGSTPEPVYKRLIEMHQMGILSFKDVRTFNLDEYMGLDVASSQSYSQYMVKHLFSGIDIQMENCHLPQSSAPAAYDELIQSAGGIDIQILGIGTNGHIGFNEPSEAFEINTHIVALDKRTREANSRFFSNEDEVPTHAVTMGAVTILRAKKIILMATGVAKAGIIKALIDSKVTPFLPASILKLHDDVTLYLDEAAAQLLEL